MTEPIKLTTVRIMGVNVTKENDEIKIIENIHEE